MAELKVNLEQLTATAEQFETQNNKMKSILDDMMNQVTALNSQWEGEASTAYITKFRALEGDITTVYNMVNEHVRDLREIFSAYQTAERESAEAAGALPTDTIA